MNNILNEIKRSSHTCISWLCLSIILLYPIVGKSEIHYKYYFSDTIKIDTIVSPCGQEFLKISGDNLWMHGETAHPEIPYTTARFLVPDNACNFSIKIDGIELYELPQSELPLFPKQQDVTINEFDINDFTYPDSIGYANFSTNIRAEIIKESWIEGLYHIVAVALYPLSYSSTLKKMGICNSCDVYLDYTLDSSQKQLGSKEHKSSLVDISNIVVNPEILKNRDCLVNEKTGFLQINQIDKYYIISEKSLLPAFKDLVSWKTQKGYNVILKAIEDIYSDARYSVDPDKGIIDKAESLRKYLQDEFEAHGTFFCLLAGDRKTDMPIRKVCWRNANDTILEDRPLLYDPNGDNYTPTDDYFSDLSRDRWKTFKDKPTGELVCYIRESYDPSIYVGRLLCHTSEEIQNYISKLILYECNPGRGNAEYLNNVIMTLQTETLAEKHKENLFNQMTETFGEVEFILDSKISDSKAAGYPTGKMVLDKLNNCGYCSWQGHGEPSTIAFSGNRKESYEWQFIRALSSYKTMKESPTDYQSQIYNTADYNSLDLLTNFDKPFVIYTPSCSTTPFDIYSEINFKFDIPHTMSSAFTVSGLYGGVAYIGNTRAYYINASANMESLFLENLRYGQKIGVAEAYSKFDMPTPSNIDWHDMHTNNLIGDPEMNVWTGKPDALNLNLFWQESGIGLQGTDQAGCRIVISDGTGDTKSFLCKRSNISYIIPYLSNNDRMVSVGIYKDGYLPVVSLGCCNQIIENCNKTFTVRNSVLGLDPDDMEQGVVIGSGANISVRAIDCVECGQSLSIDNGGNLTLKSDKIAKMDGSKVCSGGNLVVNAEKIEISNGFTVRKGGYFCANIKN
ncbi:MAG: C25 family cysteine peptidase [Muribaculum sp.]|nr:C25 family cysteine peptidase [Muribaculum sp.]